MAETPRISVVLPAYNAGRYLRQALASLRWQAFQDWECVVVDDGSTDDTPEILRQYAAADRRFRVLRQANAGIVEALNRGIDAARADWIARMDADDVALPERFARQWDFVERRPDCVAVGSQVLCIDPVGRPVAIDNFVLEHQEIESRLLSVRGQTLAHPAVLMNKQAVLEVGGYRSQYQWVEDMDLWFRLSRRGRLANLPEVLLLYRLHEGSVCWNRRELQLARLQAALAEAYEARGLPPRQIRKLQRGRSQPAGAGAVKRARRAAASGYFQTAWANWREFALAGPWNLLAARLTAETTLRAAAAVVRGRRGKQIVAPDWKPWDCGGNESRRAA